MSDNNVNISLEQILAAVLNKTGRIELTQQELISDYSQFAVSFYQTESNDVSIGLISLDEIDENEE